MESHAPESTAADSNPGAASHASFKSFGNRMSLIVLGILPLIWLMFDSLELPLGLTPRKSAPEKGTSGA